MIGFNEEIDAIQGSTLRTLASPHRVRLVHLLSAGPRDVRDIGAGLGLSQVATSQHLAALRAAGLVEATRDGRSVSYRLADPDIAIACNLMRLVLVRRLSRLGLLAAAAEPAAAVALAPSAQPQPPEALAR